MVTHTATGSTSSVETPTEAKKSLFYLSLIILLLFFPYPFLFNSSYEGNADFHSTIESIGALIGIIAGLSMIIRFYSLGTRLHLFIGLAFFINGTEDFVHGLLSFPGLHNLPASSLEQFIPGTYVTGRIIFGILLIFSPLMSRWSGESKDPKNETRMISTVVITSTLALTTIAFFINLPEFIFPESLIPRPIDFISAVILFLAFGSFLKEYVRSHDKFVWWILLSIGVNFTGQIMMSFSRSLYDPFFDIAHVYKVIGYLAPLLGFSLYQISIIAERKTAETRLMESENKLRLFMDSATDGFTLWDSDLNLLDINKAGLEMLTSDNGTGDGKGKNILDIAPFLDDAGRHDRYHRVVKTGIPYSDDDIVAPSPYGKKHLSVKAFKVGNELGMIISDVTSSKKVDNWIKQLNLLKEKLLRADNLEYKLGLITDSIVSIFGADFSRIWITKPGDRCDSDCVHARATEGPHVCRYRDRCLHLVASSGRYTHTDGEVHRRVPFGCYKIGRVAAGNDMKFITNDVINDSQVHDHEWADKLGLVSFAGYRLLSDTGSPIGVLALFSKSPINQQLDCFLEDLATTSAHVILRSSAEDALRESEEKARAILNASPDEALLLNADGTIIDLNREMEKRHNVSKKHLIGTSVYDLAEAEVAEFRKRKFREVMDSKKPVHFEDVQGGRILSNTIYPLPDHEGKIRRAAMYSRDITEWRKTAKEQQRLYAQLKDSQEQLLQAEKLRTTFTLAAGVAHELSSPIMGILNFSQYCLMHTPKDDPLRHVLEDIEHETRHCVEIIRNLLTFARAKDPITTQDAEHCQTILDRVLNLLRYRIEREGVSVSLSIDDEVPRIRMKTSEIQEVCLNLMTNALDAVQRSDRKEISIDVDRKNGFVQLMFQDTGCGIKNEIRNRIFDPFFTTKPVGKGTGLGLSISRKIVTDQGGDIKCVSGNGTMTAFEVLLPAERSDDDG